MKLLFRLSQASMWMDDDIWHRHANPWSVYSRISVLPALSLAVWSRVWLGWWSLIPLALVAAWIWVNPRIFPPPAKTSGWAVEGTFGERMFLDQRGSVAANHARPVAILTAMTMLGMVVLLTGLFILNPWIALWGMTIAMGAKLWIVDRMVWLYRESRHNLGS